MRSSLMMMVCVVAMLAGCSAEIPIVEYPQFWTPELKSIAVIPFDAANKQQGEAFADELANTLRANGTYTVFNPAEVKGMLKVQDLQIAFGSDKAAMEAQLRKIESLDVQAVMFGRVTNDQTKSEKYTKMEPIYDWDPYTKQYVYKGDRPVVMTRNESTVTATASLLRAKDSRQIHATASCGWKQTEDAQVPSKTAAECHAICVSQTVAQLVREFAVTRQVVKVNPNEAFKIVASEKCYDGKWEERKSFSSEDKCMYVVLSLPVQADRNKFRITITREGGREDLATQELVWSRQFPDVGKAVMFDLSQVARGKGNYTVKLYTMLDAKPALAKTFALE